MTEGVPDYQRSDRSAPSPVPVVTLDGESGCGKSVISKALADRLDWHYLNSGLLYRAVALTASAHKLSADASADVLSVALAEVRVRIEPGGDGELQLWLDDKDCSLAARSEEISRLASQLAVRREVRSVLLQWQQDCRRHPGLVAEGRDMGTVVFPDAIVKFYLTATDAERARRRYKQLKELGITVNMGEITREIKERDRRDTGRPLSPSKPADDALILDTTNDAEDDVLRYILRTVRARIGVAGNSTA